MTLSKNIFLLLVTTACGVQQSEKESNRMVKVDRDKVPKTVIFETDATGNSVAYYLMGDKLNDLLEKDFANMQDREVEALIKKLTVNKLRVSSSDEDLSTDELSISAASFSNLTSANTISYYGRPYSYNNGYRYNSSYGHGYDYGASLRSPFGYASGYARGYGSSYNRGSAYSRGYNNGYESSH